MKALILMLSADDSTDVQGSFFSVEFKGLVPKKGADPKMTS
jgi:hypothetical protein